MTTCEAIHDVLELVCPYRESYHGHLVLVVLVQSKRDQRWISLPHIFFVLFPYNYGDPFFFPNPAPCVYRAGSHGRAFMAPPLSLVALI